MMIQRTSQRAFLGVSALLFVVSAALTINGCKAMSAMGDMPMPGGWTMSMAWMRMPGQSWTGAAASFLGMWVLMMVAMMLPSVMPALLRYHEAITHTTQMHPSKTNGLSALVAIAYFLVWTVFGAVVFPIGAALTTVEMREPGLARLVPIAVSLVVLIAGVLQFKAWKAHHLERCRQAPGTSHEIAPNAGSAWRTGLRLGLHCSYGCAGYTAILLVIGVMDLRAMALITAAITAERVAPDGERVAQITGAVTVASGLFLITRATFLA
jgi:predicted metal-binding membrane protein